MENRIKECQLDLFADRTSAATMRANQLRLWFASFAYVLLCALRRIALKHTQFAKASCATIRLKLLKIGALVRVSVRGIKLAMASSFPHQREYGSRTPGSPPRRADEPAAHSPHKPQGTVAGAAAGAHVSTPQKCQSDARPTHVIMRTRVTHELQPLLRFFREKSGLVS